MRCIFLSVFISLWASLGLAGELETRLHSFEYASPQMVERQLRALIPEGPRVSMNPQANQVIVIADDETHGKIASMLKELGRPPSQLLFMIRHNRDSKSFSMGDGIPFTLAVSQTPPTQLIELARARLSPETRRLPVIGSALHAHVILLREDPAVARMRVIPAVMFGVAPPYQVVDFPDIAMDFMLDTENYIELQDSLTQHDFYRLFLQTQPDSGMAARPVSLLISFQGLKFVDTEKVADEN